MERRVNEVKVNGSSSAYSPNLYPNFDSNLEHLEQQEEQVATAKDRTSLPNWLMPILCTVLFILLGFVYTTMEQKINDLKDLRKDDNMEIRILRTYVINLTLEMKAKGMNPPPIPETK